MEEALREYARVGPNDELVAVKLPDFFRRLADRRQMPALPVRTGLVVVIDPLITM